ncbi:MAG TPA: hypothetical protein VFN29_05510 [Chiayiivirga sp.]|nr:hypothetical protein [Chiayiivirga sp.]
MIAAKAATCRCRAAFSLLSGYPKPTLDMDTALDAIAETTLGEVLTPHHMAQLRMIRSLSQAFAATACAVRDQIETQFPSALPATAMEVSV